MIIYFVGISCVGKTTIGKMLADKISYKFFDLDMEIEKYYGKPIERIQDECFSMNGYNTTIPANLPNKKAPFCFILQNKIH